MTLVHQTDNVFLRNLGEMLSLTRMMTQKV